MSIGIKRVYIEENNHTKYDDYGNFKYYNTDSDNTGPVSEGINDSIKGINREDANLEAELGETLFDNEKMTLHKILGKTHKKGGTPLNLNPGDFIFSNDKSLNINKKEKDLFELKFGGKITPSAMLKKEVNFKHHNKMINILDNNKIFDPIVKNSANLMLTKNLEKIGQIASIQEAKKSFPQGVPDFAENTMPIYSELIDKKITQAEQFKLGGKYLPKAQGGKWITTLPNGQAYYHNGVNSGYTQSTNKAYWDTEWQFFTKPAYRFSKRGTDDYNYSTNLWQRGNNPYGFDPANYNQPDDFPTSTNSTSNPFGNNPKMNAAIAASQMSQNNTPRPNNPSQQQENISVGNDGIPTWLKMWTQSNTQAGHITPTGMDSRYSNLTGNDIYDDYEHWNKLNGNKGFKSAKDYQEFVYDYIKQKDPSAISDMWSKMGITAQGLNNPEDNRWGFADGYFGARTASLAHWKPNNVTIKQSVPQETPITPTEAPKTPAEIAGIMPNKAEPPTKAWEPHVPLSLGQKMNIAAPFMMGAMFDKAIYPARFQQKSVVPEAQYLNDVPYRNAITNNLYAQSNIARLTSPLLANASLQNAFGESRDKELEVIGDIQNKNRGIRTQVDALKAGIYNSDAQNNMKYNEEYKKNTDLTTIGLNDMKENRFVNAFNNFNTAISQNEALENTLGILNADSPRYQDVRVFNKTTGKYEVQRQQVPYYDIKRKGFGFTTYQPNGLFDVKNYRMNNNKVDSYRELYDELKSLGLGEPTIRDIVTAGASRQFGKAQNSNY